MNEKNIKQKLFLVVERKEGKINEGVVLLNSHINKHICTCLLCIILGRMFIKVIILLALIFIFIYKTHTCIITNLTN